MRARGFINFTIDAHASEVIMRSMGWKPKIAEKSMQLDEPKQADILMLRCFDPNRHFLGKPKRKKA
jgi:hypothetical protein